MADPTTPRPKRRRLNMAGRRDRRARIFGRLRDGWSYEEIGRSETLSAARVRDIVSEALAKRAIDDGADHARLQLERLAPVLRLTADAIAEGDLSAVAPFLRVLERMDKYRQVAGTSKPHDDSVRERLLAKLNRVAVRLRLDEPENGAKGGEAPGAEGAEAGEPAEGGEGQNQNFGADLP